MGITESNLVWFLFVIVGAQISCISCIMPYCRHRDKHHIDCPGIPEDNYSSNFRKDSQTQYPNELPQNAFNMICTLYSKDAKCRTPITESKNFDIFWECSCWAQERHYSIRLSTIFSFSMLTVRSTTLPREAANVQCQ